MARLSEGPDFVCIGAQKAGTTWLFDNLEVQEAVWMPPVKEIHFFNSLCPHEELLGVEDRSRPPPRGRYRALRRRPSFFVLRWLRRFYQNPHTTDWYYSLFPREVMGTRISGDITPAYSTLDGRGVRFARKVLRPGCRVLLLLRNPVQRFWSSIKMNYRWWEDELPLDAPERLLRELEHPVHRLRGDYPRMVRLWREAFGEDFHVLRYDTLVEDPRKLLGQVGEILGVSLDLGSPRLNQRSNVDPARIQMPEPLREVLTLRYRDEIRELEEMIPGVTEGWLSDE